MQNWRLRKMVTPAVKLGWIDKDPFVQYTLRFQKVDKAFLTAAELATVERAALPLHKLHLARDLFVFCCYTGLAYADLMALTPAALCTGVDGAAWIKTHRLKTETTVQVPLLPPAQRLIEHYRQEPRALARHHLFPYLSNQKLNAYLKAIARACHINKAFSFHTARHTFATTVTLSNGVLIETVSKMLGHTKLSTTQVYARVLEQKVGADMQSLRRRLDGTA